MIFGRTTKPIMACILMLGAAGCSETDAERDLVRSLHGIGIREVSYRSSKSHPSTTTMTALKGVDQNGAAIFIESLVATSGSGSGKERWSTVRMTGLQLGTLHALDADFVNLSAASQERASFDAIRLSSVTIGSEDRRSTMTSAALAFGAGEEIAITLAGVEMTGSTDHRVPISGDAMIKTRDGNLFDVAFKSNIARVSSRLAATGATAPRTLSELAQFLDLKSWLPKVTVTSAAVTVDLAHSTDTILILSPGSDEPIPAGAGMRIDAELIQPGTPITFTDALSTWKAALAGKASPWAVTSIMHASGQPRY